MAAPVRAVLVLLVVGFLGSGVIDVLRNYEDNRCEMTWMYEQPEYHRIKLNNKFERLYSRYGLYFYGEGSYVREMKKSKFELTGVPVLFIPGNSGSYKQVRSLGSVALRKSQNMNNFFHFNYFAVDLNEELAGVYGATLYTQTQYVRLCIRKIMSLYKTSPTPPTSVILVGHSMGGMIARALFSLDGFDHNTVSTIITQATPHQGLVLMPDYHVAKFYREVNSYWRANKDTKLKDVTVVSTGGGFRDFQIRQDLVSLDGLVSPDVSVSTSSMSVPKAWVSTDHLCAVWCHQMVLVTQRALFDLVNRTTLQVSMDVQNRMSVLRYHFLQNPGSLEYLPVWEDKIEIIKPAEWEPIISKHWHIVKDKRTKFVYLTVPISQDRDKELIAISNAKVDNWVFACVMESEKKTCKDTVNLSQNGKVIPPLRSDKRVIRVELNELSEDFTHVVFVLPRGEHKAVVSGEIVSRTERVRNYKLPGILDILSAFPGSLMTRKEIFRFKGGNSVYRTVSLSGLSSIFRTYKMYLDSEACPNSTDDHDGSVMQFHVPGASEEDTFTFIKQGYSGEIAVKRQYIQTSKTKRQAELLLYLQPGCTYRLYVKAEVFDFVGQFIRFYGPLLLPFVVANILIAFLGQLRCLDKTAVCPSLLESLANTSRPYYVIPVVEGVRFIMNYQAVAKLLQPLKLPEDDSKPLMRLGIWFPAMPIILYCIALAFVAFYFYFLQIFFKVVGKVLRRVCCCLNLRLGLFSVLKYAIILSAIGLSGFVCGSLGITICYCLQLFKLISIRCSRDRSASQTPQNQTSSLFNFHFSIFTILTWLFAYEAPPVLVWARQIEFSYRLEDDPSRLAGLLCSVAYLIISRFDKPAPVRGMYTSVCYMMYAEVVLLLLYAIYSQYRLVYVLLAAIISLTVPQIVSNQVYKEKLEEKAKAE